MMKNFKHPKATPSWPQVEAAKAAWSVARKSPTATVEQKTAAREAYTAKVLICLKEAGLIR